MKILLIEPNYRSTFPPLGLLRISTYFKSIGITPKLVRGCDKEVANQQWDKIFISTLFTYELPRAVKTANYYLNSVKNPQENLFIGGVGATLLPDYISANINCKLITGTLDKPNLLGLSEPAIANFMPDYDILTTIEKEYRPSDAYFTRVSVGCIRKCDFCAVPKLEPVFRYLQPLSEQIEEVNKIYGEKKDLVVLDNNILALGNIDSILNEIKELGFIKGSRFNNKKRVLDFNQGLDVRLITPRIAKTLSELAIDPVRLALDHISLEKKYREGVKLLAENGLKYFMTYIMFNFNDSPEDFYRRIQINMELAKEYNIKITGFPMRYCPINDVDRHYISPQWNWKYLRGIQCVLNATHGVVSTNSKFFELSFGKNYNEFIEIISMPDDYIIYRNKHIVDATIWREKISKISENEKQEVFQRLRKKESTESIMETLRKKTD